MSAAEEGVNQILVDAIANSAAHEEAGLVMEQPHKVPSIITIALIAHGQDSPNDPFFDENVRIISYAGRSGSIAWSDPQTLENINREFEKYYLQYQRSLPTKGKKKYMDQLYSEFPNANKCQRMPNFIFEEDGSVAPASSYNFLKANFLKEVKDEEGGVEERDPFAYSKSNYREMSVGRIMDDGKQGDRPYLFTMEDAESGLTHRIYTPVINKLYSFIDPDDTALPNRVHFGIHVMDICNYDQKTLAKIKVGDDLLKSKAAFNRDFLAHIIGNNNLVTLQYICSYLHQLGFDVINIIDVACRAYGRRDFPPSIREPIRPHSPTPAIQPWELARARTSVHESLMEQRIDKAVGLKYRKGKSCKGKTKKSRKSRKDKKGRKSRKSKKLKNKIYK